MEKSIYSYVLRHSLRQQVVLTILAIFSFPFLYAFYELPKEIINRAIQGRNIEFPVTVLGTELGQIDYLIALSGVFLALVAVNQSFKYVINVYRGVTGERMLRRLRYQLYSRVLRFPLPVFRRMSSGETIQMITAETEPLGGFVGDSFSVPVFQGGTLLVILAFLLWQNVYMALAAIALYPAQFYVIPKLQRRVNALAKQRVRLVRRIADRIGETIGSIHEVHAHDAARLELAKFAHHMGEIYEVRLRIYIWKFVIKFINNSVNHLGPFFFYSIGGYFVIMGELQIGTLMAAIAAHKDLAAPWKELLAYYQQREDARIKYEQVVAQFGPPGMLDERLQSEEPQPIPHLEGEVAGANVTLIDESGATILDGATFRFRADEHVALIGPGASGKEELAMVIARLLFPSAGSVTIGGMRLADLPEAVTGRRIGYVGPAVQLFAASVRENLSYALRHRPLAPPTYDEDAVKRRERYAREAEAAGNIPDDLAADWIDYESAGLADAAALERRILEVLRLVDLESDVYDLGLRGAIDPVARPDLAERFLAARAHLRERLAEPEIAPLVEAFDAAHYNDNATMAENLFFGLPKGDAFDMDRLAEHAYVREVLERAGLADDLLDIGRQVAETMIELFADLPPGHPFFEQYSFVSADELEEFQGLLGKIRRDGMEGLGPDERRRLMSLPFKLRPARHRLGVIDDALKARLLDARRLFAKHLPDELKDQIEFYDLATYNPAASLMDNILFGKVAYGVPRAGERVGALIREVIEALDLQPAVIEVGLEFQVGIAGARLATAQRQKLGLARATLKRPDLLVVNDAIAPLDNASQIRIMGKLLQEFEGRGVAWALGRAELAEYFDRVLVLQAGKVVAAGAYDELDGDEAARHALKAAH